MTLGGACQDPHLPIPFFLKPSYLHLKPERTSYVNLDLKTLFPFPPFSISLICSNANFLAGNYTNTTA